MGYWSFKNHVEQNGVYKLVAEFGILGGLKWSSGILCRFILLYGGQSLETETGGVVRVLAFSGRISSRKLCKRGGPEEQSAGPVHILLQITTSDTNVTYRLLGMLRLGALERPPTVD